MVILPRHRQIKLPHRINPDPTTRRLRRTNRNVPMISAHMINHSNHSPMTIRLPHRLLSPTSVTVTATIAIRTAIATTIVTAIANLAVNPIMQRPAPASPFLPGKPCSLE